MEDESPSFLGGFLFGNVDESGFLDNEDFDKELQDGLSSFVKNAKSFGLETIGMIDSEEKGGSGNRKDDGHEPAQREAVVPSALDLRLAGLIFLKGPGTSGVTKNLARYPRFTNLFRSGMLPPETATEEARPLKYRLRRYRVRRKKHPRPIHYLEDQCEDFRKRKYFLTGGPGGMLSSAGSRSSEWLGSATSLMGSGQASRYRVLSQLRHNVASTASKKQSARARALEAILQKRSKQEAVSSRSIARPEALAEIWIDEHRLHPVETTSWEDNIILEDEHPIDVSWADRRLTAKFVEIRQVPSGPAKPAFTGSLLSFLQSRMASGYASPPVRTTTVQPNLLKRPESEATRVINHDLEYGNWDETIIWDEEAPAKLPPTKLLLDVNDPHLNLDIIEEKGDGAGGISFKDLARLTKHINKAKAKKAAQAQSTGAVVPPASAVVKATNYSKIQSGDKFNLSNDKYYEAASTAADATATVSKATRQSMVKSQLAARIGLQHSVPATKLIFPFFKTGWSKTELRAWHRPFLLTPIEPTLKFTEVGKKVPSGSVASQVLRNAKKIGIRDGSDYVILEYSDEFPLLMMNSGMATFLQHFWRKTGPKDVPPPLELKFGTLKVLEPNDPSPFWMFGDVPPGKVMPMIQNNLFRALLFEHASAPTDFMAIRSHIKGKAGTKLYLRPLPQNIVLVGQEFPTAQVPGPHSRKQNSFARARVQVFSYRLFAKDTTAAITGRPRLKISRILSAFPQYSEGSIRKWLKEYAESVRGGNDSGIWQRKSDAPVLSEDDLRALITPELVCANESMLVGQQRLQDAGIDTSRNAGANEDEGHDDEDHLLDDDAAGELQLAPWNLTANLANAILGKSALQLKGAGDSSGGRGECFSFVRIPTKMAAAKIPDSQGDEPSAPTKRTKGGNVDQAAYKQEIAKIWAAQIKALSDPNPPGDSLPEANQGTATTMAAASDAWKDIMRSHTGDDDEAASVHSASQSAGTSTVRSGSAKQRRLVITRTRKGPEAQTIIESETITDPFLIQAYLKERKQMDAKLKRKHAISASNAARAAARPPKPPAAPKPPKEPRPPKAPKKLITIKCGTCGGIGHMRTNRICPLYSQYEAEMAMMGGVTSGTGSVKGSQSAMSLDPGAVRIAGTKISITKATLSKVKPAFSVAQHKALTQFSLFLQDVVAALVAVPVSWPFRRPVSRKEYPHYFKMIAKPIDLGTIRARAKRQTYRTVGPFLQDVRLVAENCARFNLEDHPFTAMAREVVVEAERLLEDKKEQVEAWMDEIHPDRATISEPALIDMDEPMDDQGSIDVQMDDDADADFDADGDVDMITQSQPNANLFLD